MYPSHPSAWIDVGALPGGAVSLTVSSSPLVRTSACWRS